MDEPSSARPDREYKLSVSLPQVSGSGYDFDDDGVQRTPSGSRPAPDPGAAIATTPAREDILKALKAHKYTTAGDRFDVEYEQFRRYLDESGTMLKLAGSIEKLLDETDVNDDALRYPRNHFLSVLGEGKKPRAELKALKAEILKMERSLDRVLDENTNLRRLLKIREPTPPASDDDDEFYDELVEDALDDGDRTSEEKAYLVESEGLRKVYEELLGEEERKLHEEHRQKTAASGGASGPGGESEMTEPEYQPFRLGSGERAGEYEDEGEEMEDLETEAEEVWPLSTAEAEEGEFLGEVGECDGINAYLTDSDVEYCYDASNIVDHFSDSDHETDSDIEDEPEFVFDKASGDEDCVSDDSELDAACAALEGVTISDDGFEQNIVVNDQDDTTG